MKAILVNPDRSLSWSEVPNPEIKADEVLVEIHATAINRADLMQREGDYPPPPGCPEWMGLEVAGEIVALGEEAKAHWNLGDRVCALLGGGGYAEQVAVRYDMLMPIPKNCSMEQAAAIPEAFATGYLNLFYEGKYQEGNTVLVTAGGSGLASVIIPMAKAFGARVLTTVSSAAKAEKIAHLGADLVIDLSTQDLAEVLKAEWEAGRGVDIAIDCLGGEMLGRALHHLNYGARWVVIAALRGQKAEIDLKNLYVKNVKLLGSTLRSKPPAVKAQILAEIVERVYPKIESGEVLPSIDSVFPITEAEAAQDVLYQNKNVGKVVMKVK